MLFFFYRTLMTWSDGRDLTLLMEVTAVNPFIHRKGTKERGKAWTDVAENLQKHAFKVDQRAVRDRYVHLQTKNKQKNAVEKRASGIAPEEGKLQTDSISLLEELLLLEEEAETSTAKAEEVKKEEQKKVDGVEMRKRLVETFGETSKR